MNKILELAWLIPLFPLIGFLINGLFRKQLSKSAIGLIGSGVILISFCISIMMFLEVKTAGFISSQASDPKTGVVSYFDFIGFENFRIPFSFQIDQLSSLFLLIITGVGFLIHVYSTS